MPLPPSVATDRPDRPNLAEFVAARIAEWIESRQLRAGERLPSEPELMRRFGVSRNVVREGVSKLKALGVASVFQGKGAFVNELPHDVLLMRVRRLSHQDALVSEIWEVRETLESRIVELACERATPEDFEQIAAAIEAVEVAIGAGELGTPEDQQFHRALARAAHNLVFEQLMTEVVDLMQPLLQRLLSAEPSRPSISNREHTAILAALKSRDPRRAKRAMAEHLANGRRMFAAQ